MAKKKKSKKKANNLDRIIRREVRNYLKHYTGRGFNHKQIAAGAGLKGTISAKKLVDILDNMAADGLLEKMGRGKYKLVHKAKEVTGTIEILRDGYGFVTYDENEADLFIPRSRINKAMSGDTVRVKVSPKRKRNQRTEGEVLEVLHRARTEFVATIVQNRSVIFAIPDDHKLGVDFYIDPKNLNDAKDGDKVRIRFVNWKDKSPEGKVIDVLGPAGENDTEMHAILFQYGFEPEFPEHVEAEANAISTEISKTEIGKRRDLRDVLTFTIDPVDAKDFDDAISYKELADGRFELGVHIADVSHYVRPGTELDKEAFRRATSVYLVDRTVPMLPEALSNQLCSLRPNEDKLAYSAIFEIDPDHNVVSEWYGRTVIHSDRRFTYGEAQELIEGQREEIPFNGVLQKLNNVAKAIRGIRYKQGAIDFEEDEVKFELDEEGKPIRVYRKVRKDAHKLIEEYMLLANRMVSAYVSKLRKEPPLTFVYRIHDRPDPEKLNMLSMFVKSLGYKVQFDSPRTINESLNNLLNEVEGKPEQNLVRTVAVRAMAKAIYSTVNIGHYGLGFQHYSHFTSPIRRYPDVLAHRLLDQYMKEDFRVDPESLEAQCKHSSDMERKAAEAERASVKHKQVEFLEDKVGQQFEGNVSGITKWGVYVELDENKCEGMIPVAEFRDDYYVFNEEHYCMVGSKYGEKIRLGDRLKIEIKETNIHRKTIDFAYIEFLDSVLKDVEQ